MPDSRRYIIQNGLPVDEIEDTLVPLPANLAQIQDPIALYVGRLCSDTSAAKNVKSFLEVIAWVRRKHKITGILCGEGPQRGDLEKARHELGLDDDIYFTGHVHPGLVWTLMKKAAIFVSLSNFEGCPNAVMEAMACGCPLVLSDIQAHREILDESCALLVDPFNIQSAAEAVLNVLTDANASNERALAARERSRKYSVNAAARNLERVYEECI